MSGSRALGIALGHALDRGLGDPRRGHPVAAFGRLAAALESHIWADSRARGLAHSAVLTGGAVAVGMLAERATRDHPVLHLVATAGATWAVLGGTTLGREATAVHDLLAAGDFPAARRRLTHLVGRNTAQLDESEVARAVVESVAENTSDAVVAPLVLGAVAGMPGLLGYRAANTLDAMVGHRSERYRSFGWASARLDDLLNLPGSRTTGALAAALAPTVGGRPVEALAAWHRDARHHPSPNAGVAEASYAGALGLRLGGPTPYAHGVEHRVVMGGGRPPVAADIGRAVRLSRRVCAASVALAALAALAAGRVGAAARAGG